jgi:hypothetical protein
MGTYNVWFRKKSYTQIEPKNANKSPLSPLYKKKGRAFASPCNKGGIEGNFIQSMWKDIWLFYKVLMNEL